MADAQALPFEPASFDALACQFGVMFFPDKVAAFAEARRVLRPGGRYVFSVWGDLAANDMTDVVQQAMAGLFGEGPASFFERVPFGYHDRERIAAALRGGGFDDIAFETVTLETPAPSAEDAARGLCLGTPLRSEIERLRPGGEDEVVAVAAEALRARFGPGPIRGQGQALVATATA